MRASCLTVALVLLLVGGLVGSCGSASDYVATVLEGIASGGDSNPIPLPDAATPPTNYPSNVVITTPRTSITGLTVLVRVTHSRPRDIDLLLVGPTGQTLLLMADCLQSSALTNELLVFQHDSVTPVPDATLGAPLSLGPLAPTNYNPGGDTDVFAGPAPIGPYGLSMAPFLGTNPNGTWSLYATDDEAGGTGTQIDSWGLLITADP